jgi:hypothetical protein
VDWEIFISIVGVILTILGIIGVILTILGIIGVWHYRTREQARSVTAQMGTRMRMSNEWRTVIEIRNGSQEPVKDAKVVLLLHDGSTVEHPMGTIPPGPRSGPPYEVGGLGAKPDAIQKLYFEDSAGQKWIRVNGDGKLMHARWWRRRRR